ncbi:hypothetical protein MHH70_03085 [Metasolibacillus sp. FSL H7-0170]|uniref:hypothetical protein n=1 Tax=unclassified Metasolibacillus TaxID=2703679 RepID=UPI0007936AD0|nr:hypothetical protein A0U40_03300 [[Bacillus] sp. KCTC 13219]
MQIHSQIIEKMKQLEQQTTNYVKTIQQQLEQKVFSKETQLISYFTSSMTVSHEREEENFCLASYHILNVGTQPITNPSIHLRLHKHAPFSFSGKYIIGQMKQTFHEQLIWERFNDVKSKHELWFKPVNQSIIAPNEMIVFPHFQLTWTHQTPYFGLLEGWTYCDEIPEGSPVINPLHICSVGYAEEGADAHNEPT